MFVCVVSHLLDGLKLDGDSLPSPVVPYPVVLFFQKSSNEWAVHSVAGCLHDQTVQQALHDLNSSVSPHQMPQSCSGFPWRTYAQVFLGKPEPG